MKITATNVYVGPSIYANFPVIRMVLDIGVLVDWPSVKCGKGFTRGLQKAIPSLAEHGCSYREPGGFLRRLTEDDGTWMGHIMEHVALEIQNIAGSGVSFGRTRTTGEVGMYSMDCIVLGGKHPLYGYWQTHILEQTMRAFLVARERGGYGAGIAGDCRLYTFLVLTMTKLHQAVFV